MAVLARTLDSSFYQPVSVFFAEGPVQQKLLEEGRETVVFPLSEKVVQLRKDSLGRGIFFRLGSLMHAAAGVWRLSRFIRSQQPDLVHTHSLKADIMAGLAARIARVPVIWHVRDQIEPNYLPRPMVQFYRGLARVVPSLVIANSQSTLQTVHLPSGKPAAVVYSGIPMPPEPAPRPPDGQIKIGLVGRLAQWKGQHIFLQAAAAVHKKCSQARFALIGAALFGEEEYEQSLHQLCRQLQLEDVVEWQGFRTDVMQAMGELDIVVHASVTPEPFGQVVIQGMALAKPVVATAGGGVLESMVDGETGLLAPMNDAEKMADALLWLIEHPAEAAEMGKKGRARVEALFTERQTAHEVEKAYQRLFNGREAAPQ